MSMNFFLIFQIEIDAANNSNKRHKTKLISAPISFSFLFFILDKPKPDTKR